MTLPAKYQPVKAHRLLRERKITHEQVAAECRPPVSRPMVNMVLHGQAVSANVEGAVRRLLGVADLFEVAS